MNGPLSNRPADGAALSAGARRMARHRNRRRKGLRCITIEIFETEINALMRRELLAPNNRTDITAIRKALHAWLDDALR
jgi:hypothetical protein